MEKITFKHFKTNLIAQPFFVWHALEIASDDLDLEFFWDQDPDFADTSVQQVMVQTFKKIDKKLSEIFLSKGAIQLTGNVDERIVKTEEYIGSDKIVLSPVFEYNGALSKPFAFDFKNNILINLKYSKKTKRMDFVQAYYDLSIINEILEVKDYNLYLPLDAEGLKGEINLTMVDHINLSKTGDTYDACTQDGSPKSTNVMKEFKNPEVLTLKDIDLYIEEINQARDINEINTHLENDATEFGDNPFWNELLEKLSHKYSGISGYIAPKKKIVENAAIDNNVFRAYEELNEAMIMNFKRVDDFINQLHMSEKIVWYDFEGFSLPYPAVDYTKSFQQIVFQLSKIETNGNIEEHEVRNYVWDPLKINVGDLYKVLCQVYSGGADKYVVYNKTYENTRLKEIVKLLRESDYYDEAQKMFDHIEANTLDLWDLFKINNGGKVVPPIMFHDQYCKSSIKNIEKHISLNQINLPYSIKEYKNLDVKNGVMAMDVAIKRAIGVMGESQWAEKVEKLKEYCENDVRMMIMVYHFIKYLIWKGKIWEKDVEEVDIQNNTAQ